MSVSLHTLETKYRGVDGVANSLMTDPKVGIEATVKDLESRTARYGSNK